MARTKGMSRRRFLATSVKGAVACGAVSTLAGCSFVRSLSYRTRTAVLGGKRRRVRARQVLRLGLDTYSLHHCLTARNPSLRRDLWWVLDQLDPLGLRGVQIDPSHFPGSDEATLKRLASVVRPRGHYVEFGMGGWDVGRLEERIALTARFGGRAVRTFCGDYKSSPERLALFLTVAPPALREAAKAAERYGVDIAVENHGDFTSAQLQELLDRVGHPRVGACLDTGNSLFRGEDPLACARILAPYTRSMHLKDWTMTRLADGSVRWKEAVPGTGQVPVAKILRAVADEGREIFVALEAAVQASDDEAETIEREWRHVQASAAAARQIVARLG